jgi:hypothetical protein
MRGLSLRRPSRRGLSLREIASGEIAWRKISWGEIAWREPSLRETWAGSSAMILRMEARISSIEGS